MLATLSGESLLLETKSGRLVGGFLHEKQTPTDPTDLLPEAFHSLALPPLSLRHKSSKICRDLGRSWRDSSRSGQILTRSSRISSVRWFCLKLTIVDLNWDRLDLSKPKRTKVNGMDGNEPKWPKLDWIRLKWKEWIEILY